MDIQVIREFISVAKGTILSEVADQYFISQSLLSVHIRKLEEELGCALFTRTSRALELNENGRLFLSYAEKMIAAFDAYRMERTKKMQDSVSVGVIGSMAQVTAEKMISSFYKENSDVKLNITSRDYPQRLFDFLESGECDFGFMYCENAVKDGLVSIPLFEDYVVAAIPYESELSKRGSITREDLKNERILMQNADRAIFHKVVDYLTASGTMPNISFAVNSESLMIDLLKCQAGIGLVVKGGAERLEDCGVAVVDVEPKLDLVFSMLYSGNAKFTAAGEKFLHFIQDNYLKHGSASCCIDGQR